MGNRPNKWIAGILSFFVPPLGMIFVAQLVWAAIYFFAAIGIVALMFVLMPGSPYAVIFLSFALNVVAAFHSYKLASLYSADKIRPHYSRWYGLLGIYLGTWFVVFGFRSFLFEPFRAPAGSMLPTIEVGSILIAQKWGYGHYGSYGFTPFQQQISAELRRGDILVFDYPDKRSIQYVKRLIGLPGDKITYRDKQLSINGKKIAHRKDGEYINYGNGALPPVYLSRFVEIVDGKEYSVVENEEINRIFPDTISFLFKDKCKYDAQAVTCEVPAGHYYFMGDNRDNSRDSRYWGFVPADHIVGKVVYVMH
ncbi:MAG: signal peptidase I [Gallionellales bacterium 35-53-114]|jgi:signal peptidase I|nr:MAG: signal peptidase I [Gallionellales bacterium 35-53-114]OYZ64819.1 MAG: signal peptidase I [Gallionellales bacterium 24-53-125]OZB07643.1 MAG: signal peptidase I [Gallionellales bacterium 39-52-133]HQS58667.1 signal peptidase I [Gallionellaceae bacterium]HQS75007.1 signal peptidase I [Gallionellaceae bacterium]